MKELSIEQKAKHYDEAIERAIAWRKKYVNSTISEDGTMVQDFDNIFPELKESEDEKIRKEIMDFIDTKTIDSDERRNRWFSYLEKYKPISFTSLEDIKVKVSLMQYISELNQDVVHLHPGIETCNEWIAWLEKQGQTFTKKDVDDAYLKGVCDAKQEIEKQGEQKSAEFKPSFRVGDVIKPKDPVLGEPRIIKGIHPKFGYDTNNGILDFEFEDNWELVEQKPANKVEPKFKVGDWIIGRATNNEPRQISEITDNYYKSTYGGQYGFSFEDEMHLWTIQDAKDGDVLSCNKNGWTCIFKTLNNDGSFCSYCFIDANGWFYESGSDCHRLTKEIIKVLHYKYCPATKEQRETLMKAMTDAGYTFDFEKKELKKMKQPNWSEEDEYYYGIVQYILNNERVGKADKENASNWFKSIKDRILPQPKRKWNEEDEKTLNEIFSVAARASLRKSTLFGKSYDYIKWQNWLKSLKPQSHWKPSEEQMKILNKVIFCTYNANNIEDRKHIESLYNDLKKLTE